MKGLTSKTTFLLVCVFCHCDVFPPTIFIKAKANICYDRVDRSWETRTAESTGQQRGGRGAGAARPLFQVLFPFPAIPEPASAKTKCKIETLTLRHIADAA